MKAKRLIEVERDWNTDLQKVYESEPKRTRTHVSDLTWCLRQSALSRIHKPNWTPVTLYRFTMGRAMENVFFSNLMPNATQEMEVESDGIVGHIDFGSDPVDYECKLTWGKEPDEDDIQSWFEDSKGYWLTQAGAYTYMRGRTTMNFVVCFVSFIPRIRCYEVSWDKEELQDMWDKLLDAKEYLDFKDALGELPMKTLDTYKCKSCQFKEVCDESE